VTLNNLKKKAKRIIMIRLKTGKLLKEDLHIFVKNKKLSVLTMI